MRVAHTTSRLPAPVRIRACGRGRHAKPGRLSAVADQVVVGKSGRVTGRISPGRLGEVMIPIRGGSEAYHAYSVDRTEEIAPGESIVVIEYHPPRTVVVTRV